MQKQRIQAERSLKKATIAFFMVLGLITQATAQKNLVTPGLPKIKATGSYVDYSIQEGFKVLYLEAKGGDGGNSKNKSRVKAGRGATVKGWARIGNSHNEIPVGSTIRFISGRRGYTSRNNGGGGGGGTAVVFRKPGKNSWQLLMVAGGGGGAGVGSHGREAQFREGGASGKNPNNSKLSNAGSNGRAGGSKENAYGGGGAYGSASGNCGGNAGFNARYVPVGGTVDCVSNDDFGFGFGAGGRSSDGNNAGSGGGGYSGGGAGKGGRYGDGGGGGGGGSYVNEKFFYFTEKKANGTIKSVEDGYVKYELITGEYYTTIDAVNRENKCLSVREVTTLRNGTNILLSPCKDNKVNQQWIFDGTQLRYKGDPDRCLDLSKSNTKNGTNIHLWECNGSKAQQWIFDGLSKLIRYRDDWSKCLSRPKADDIQIWDCNGPKTLLWTFDGATTAADLKRKPKRIKFARDEAWGIDERTTSSGKNVHLEKYSAGDYGHWWYFNDHKIRQYARSSAKGQCMSLHNNDTKNGANIIVAECADTPAQRWIYDGRTKTIRSQKDPTKCLNKGFGGAEDQPNISLYECNGTENQQWIIENMN